MHKRYILVTILLLFLSSLACLIQGNPSLKPPAGSSGKNVPLYTNSHHITLKDSDLQTFLGDYLWRDLELRYSSNSYLAWTEDSGTQVKKQFDKTLPEADWRLNEDWSRFTGFDGSLWTNGNLELLVAYFDKLNNDQINDFERKYGIFDLEKGCTLIFIFVWDSHRPLPTPTLSDRPTPSPLPIFARSTEVEIIATQGWQSTGIIIEQGATVTIKVISGQWTKTMGSSPYNTGEGSKYVCNHAGCVEPLPGFPSDGLIGQIGNQIFAIGNSTDIVAPQTGTLMMRMNDGDTGLFDNDGSLTVQIMIEK